MNGVARAAAIRWTSGVGRRGRRGRASRAGRSGPAGGIPLVELHRHRADHGIRVPKAEQFHVAVPYAPVHPIERA